MGVSIGGNNQTFFNLLGTEAMVLSHSVTGLGGTVKVQFTNIEIVDGIGNVTVSPHLPTNTTAIMKGGVGSASLNKTAGIVNSFFKQWIKAHGGNVAMAEDLLTGGEPGTMKPAKSDLDLEAEMEAPAPTIADMKVKGVPLEDLMSEAEALKLVEKLKAKFPNLQKAKLSDVLKAKGGPVSKSTLDMVVDLHHASYLGQAVFGTSSGSIYRVIALGERIRMAARLQAGQLSVRVEGPINSAEADALHELNFKKSTHNGHPYWSSHFGLNGVPAERIVGVLFFHNNLPLNQRVESLVEAYLG